MLKICCLLFLNISVLVFLNLKIQTKGFIWVTAQALDPRAAQLCLFGFSAAHTCCQSATVCNPSVTSARLLQQRSGEEAELYKGRWANPQTWVWEWDGSIKHKTCRCSRDHRVTILFGLLRWQIVNVKEKNCYWYFNMVCFVFASHPKKEIQTEHLI